MTSLAEAGCPAQIARITSHSVSEIRGTFFGFMDYGCKHYAYNCDQANKNRPCMVKNSYGLTVETFEEAAEGFVGLSWASGFAEVVFRLRKKDRVVPALFLPCPTPRIQCFVSVDLESSLPWEPGRSHCESILLKLGWALRIR